MRFLAAIFLAFSSTTITQAQEETRTWTSGTYTVEARFVKFDEGEVELDTGVKTIRISEDKLSKLDK